MNPKLVPGLQKIFQVVGWSVLVLAVVNIGMQIYHQAFPPTGLVPFGKEPFELLFQVRLLFTSLAQAFFAFLMSAVFDMVFRRRAVRAEQAEIFLKLTIVGFVGEGVINILSWVRMMWQIVVESPDREWMWAQGALYFLQIAPHLLNFVYAASIYILFRHFSALVEFESEVV
jgi:hypothetical protein